MSSFLKHIEAELEGIKEADLYKVEREIVTPQAARIETKQGKRLNLCANNYLGLADHPALISAANNAMKTHGFGLASVRFICGTHDMHRVLEKRLAEFLGMDDTILFAACFDANGGVFEPLLTAEDAVVSDALNHASIIDGIRLSKARRYRYATNDMSALEAELQKAREEGARHVMIVTDGVFSMDGTLANLTAIRALADKYDAQIFVDDCHATGFMGPKGAGTPHHAGVKVDILTGTLGKAMGGGLGGYIAGAQPVIDLLRQRARPYLFSNALPPAIVGAGIKALELVEQGDDLRAQLFENARYWREGLTNLGFDLLPGEHPIIPVMIGDAPRAQAMAKELDAEGVFVSAFFFPVVPRGMARLRTQMNAALTREDLDFGLEAFAKAGRATGVI